MKPVNSKVLKKFISVSKVQLSGEWILMGGALLPALGLYYRSTLDIDIVSIEPRNGNSNLELMKLAEQIGLSIESVNSAAGYFLYKIPKYKENLIVMVKSKTMTLYRPNAYLFLLTKTARLTESDATDCIHYFKYCKKNQDPINSKNIQSHLKRTIGKSQGAKKLRLQRVLDSIS